MPREAFDALWNYAYLTNPFSMSRRYSRDAGSRLTKIVRSGSGATRFFGDDGCGCFVRIKLDVGLPLTNELNGAAIGGSLCFLNRSRLCGGFDRVDRRQNLV